ncbi:MAG: heme ABC transporter ATP-binding protein [Acidobacteria bacterium]|nr:MAG: heme ABC transporter ATP-binding protein [Acidobacteriota bacterium]
MRRSTESTEITRSEGDFLLQARDLHFSYSATHPVLKDVSFSLQRGTLSALIGANGCGKSTLIRLLAGLIFPARGEITFQGAPLLSFSRRRLARRMAYVPQTQAMIFPFTAFEVVLTGRSVYTPRFHFESVVDCEKARLALEAVGAWQLAERPVTELSGGERQMVALARALAQEPLCLLLDEPSAGPDLKHRARLIRLLCRLRDQTGLTALVVTHDLGLLDPTFDYVFALARGAIVAEGTPVAVLTDPILAEVYDDAYVHAGRLDGHTFVWSEA